MRRWLIAVWLLVGLSGLAVLLVAATTGGARAQETAQFEYKIVPDAALTPEKATATLNRESADGWELMAGLPVQYGWHCSGPMSVPSNDCRSDWGWQFVMRRPRQ
jgi:hypothetical protein